MSPYANGSWILAKRYPNNQTVVALFGPSVISGSFYR